jgi:hypothetical protein
MLADAFAAALLTVPLLASMGALFDCALNNSRHHY